MADNENTFLNADNIYMDVEGEAGKSLDLELEQQTNLVGTIKDRFYSAEDKRNLDEARWLKAYENYRGLYNKSVKFRDSEKSRIFVKITKTKVLAAFGQLVDVIFGTGKFPIGIAETKIPEGELEHAHLDINNPQPGIETSIGETEELPDDIGNRIDNPYDVGFEGDGKALKPGATLQKGVFTESLEDQADDMLVEGLSPNPQALEVSPAQKAARRMEKLIHDQIDESKGSSEIRNALLESALLGTGIVKGPFNFNKKLNKWDMGEDGERNYNPIEVRVPRIEFVSCWDFYPDPAATSIEECEYVVHRHKMNKSQLRQLRNMPYFDEDAIRACLTEGPNYIEKDFEYQLKDDARNDEYQTNFEVIEYWGIMDAEYAREVGIELSDDIDDLDEVQINAWVCGNQLLRAVINPFTPYRIPYHAFPYERNPYNFFGIGVAENMDDSQQIMNGHARMAVDNLAMAGSLVFDVDESALVGGQSMEIYPGKIFRRQAGMPGQAIHGLKFPNTAPENMMMFDKFRQLADEQTGIPSYSHGQTGVQSMTRTASGMSMLLGASSLNIKTVVKNLDDFLLRPLGESFFQWNMQFFEGDLDVKGDLEVKATGTNSLMQKEVRSQRLMTFMQTASNPALAPFVRWHTCLTEIAKSLDIDPDQLINDPEKAAIYAQIMGMANGNQNNTAAAGGQDQMGQTGPIPTGASPTDPSGAGGGNIGTGNVSMPGEAGFSAANTQPTRGEQTQ